MLSPEARAAAERLIAILLVLIEALAAPTGKTRQRFFTRLAARAMAAGLRRLSDQLRELAAAPVATPAETASPAQTQDQALRRIVPRRSAAALHGAPARPRTAAIVAPAPRQAAAAQHTPIFELSASAARLSHAQFVPVS